jgi:hypothetical protein
MPVHIGIDTAAAQQLSSGGSPLDTDTIGKIERSRISGAVLTSAGRFRKKCLAAASEGREASVLFRFAIPSGDTAGTRQFDPTDQRITEVDSAAVVMARLYAVAAAAGLKPVVAVSEDPPLGYAAVLGRWGKAAKGEGPFDTDNFTWRLPGDGELPAALTTVTTGRLLGEDADLRLGVTLSDLATAVSRAEMDLIASVRSQVASTVATARKRLLSAASHGLGCRGMLSVKAPKEEGLPIAEADIGEFAYLFVAAEANRLAPVLVARCQHDGSAYEGRLKLGLLFRWSADLTGPQPVIEDKNCYWRPLKANERRERMPTFEDWMARARRDDFCRAIKLDVDPSALVTAMTDGPLVAAQARSLKLLGRAWSKCNKASAAGRNTTVLFKFDVDDDVTGVYVEDTVNLHIVRLLLAATKAEGLDITLAVDCTEEEYGLGATDTPPMVSEYDTVAVLLRMPSDSRPPGYALTENHWWRVMTPDQWPSWMLKS